MNRTAVLFVAGALIALAAVVYVGKRQFDRLPQDNVADSAAPPPAAPPTPEPAARYPLEPAADAHLPSTPLPPLARADTEVRTVLAEWLGRDAVASYLQLGNFVRNSVATLDNFGRSHAASRLWPVNPAPGRFSVVQRGDAFYIAPGNAERYAPFVAFVESIDTDRAVALYGRWYPWLQQAYEELGYPGKYFNDRVVDVIDQLIATPVPSGPIEVRLTEVKGPIASTRPWVRYEFADPSLESLSAGQKMLVRFGPVQQQRLKAKLVDLRRKLTAAKKP